MKQTSYHNTSVDSVFQSLNTHACTTVIPRQKFSQALKAMHNHKPICFEHRRLDDFVDEIGATIRQGMAKLRELKEASETYRRAMAKACYNKNIDHSLFNIMLQL